MRWEIREKTDCVWDYECYSVFLHLSIEVTYTHTHTPIHTHTHTYHTHTHTQEVSLGHNTQFHGNANKNNECWSCFQWMQHSLVQTRTQQFSEWILHCKIPLERKDVASRDSAGGGGGTEHFCGGNQTLEVWKKQNNQRLMRGNYMIRIMIWATEWRVTLLIKQIL